MSAQSNLRPLSQSGLIRVPRNPKQRRIDPATGAPTERKVLDAINDREECGYLHPTKGWRPVSTKRSVATLIAAEMKQGRRWTTSAIRKALRQ